MPPNTHHHHHRITDLVGCNVDISFPLHRLYDEYNLDHIPPEKRMDLFKHRNMARVKHYKSAVNVFGGPASRKRILIAPPMETPLKHRLGLYPEKAEPPRPPALNSHMEPRKASLSPILTESALADMREQDEVNNYKSWVKQRRQFRKGLEGLGLNEEWLRKKKDRTVIEERMLQRFVEARRPVTPTPEPEVVVQQPTLPPPIPVMEIPAPVALEKLDRYARLNQLRVYDIFVQTDKNKDWKMTKEEMMNILRAKEIPITESELEDLITALDINMDDCLSYEELALGMSAYRKEKRDRGRRLDRTQSGSDHTPSSGSDPNSRQSSANLGGRVMEEVQGAGMGRVAFNTDVCTTEEIHSPMLAGSKDVVPAGAEGTEEVEADAGADGKPRRRSPHLLTPPEVDTGPEHIQLSQEALVDLRKKTATILRQSREGSASGRRSAQLPPGVIVTGNPAVDAHCQWSTLEGPNSQAVDDFRQRALRQYYQVLRLCEERDIVLSKKLLERVLLYPSERPRSSIQKSVRQPGQLLTYRYVTGRRETKKRSKQSRRKEKLLAMQNAETTAALAASAAGAKAGANGSSSGDQPVRAGPAVLAGRAGGRGQLESREGGEEGQPLRAGLSSKLPGRGAVSRPKRMTLSTGKAYISPSVDSWLTFEDFIDITGEAEAQRRRQGFRAPKKRMQGKFTDLNLASNTSAFWPGQLLDKIVLVMDRKERGDGRHGGNAVFHHTGQKKSAYPGHHGGGLAAWPMSDAGYIMDGHFDPHRNKIKAYT